MNRSTTRIARVVLGCTLFGWYVNIGTGTGFSGQLFESLDFPIRSASFGAVLSDPRLALFVYFAPLLALGAFFSRNLCMWRSASFLLVACALVACLHLQLCNDATFVTALWVSLWLVWFLYNQGRDAESVSVLGIGLAHSVVGLMFLGALVLKLTPDYETGAAFHGLYFQQEQGWPYPWLREQLSPEQLRIVAAWFSRVAISAETMLAASPFLPTWVVLPLFSLVAASMLVARSFQLVSVHASLFGVLIAAELLRRYGARARRTKDSAT